MSVSKQIIPPATALINGIRAIGYSFSTAVADIIDNSISAEAKEINIYSDPLAKEPYFVIVDDGCGMNLQELENAMTFGSDRSGKIDCLQDLGRFGLGLKTASLSQCRNFVVISKKFGRLHAMSYELDNIEKTNTWEVQILSDSEILKQPCVEMLDNYKSGTIVIWKKFDRVECNTSDFEESFRSVVSEAKKHIEFVFHRFYNNIKIYFNNKLIERRDPFLSDSEKTQKGRSRDIYVDNDVITVTPYSLPYANTLNSDQKKLLGNPKSIYDEQGFYIYRNKRLIYWGSWMHMGYKSELNKLARVQVDIPSSLDSMWMLDVKKSSAKIPDKIKEQIRSAIKDSTIRSARVTRFQGIKETQEQHPIWQRINLREGFVKYEISRDNPLLQTLNEMIGEEEKVLLENILSQIECYLPKGRIQNDNADAINIVNSGSDVEEEVLINQICEYLLLIPEYKRDKQLEEILKFESYAVVRDKVKEIQRRMGNG